MPVSLLPNRIFDRYQDVTPQYLRRKGVTLLLSDLDFTLAPKSVHRPDQALRDWMAGRRGRTRPTPPCWGTSC